MTINSNDRMGLLIEAAKKKAEQEYQSKADRIIQSDTRAFIPAEELDQILSHDDFFSGTLTNLTKEQRYEKLAMATRWMDIHCMAVRYIQIEQPSSARSNTSVTLELRRLSDLRNEELRVFTYMSALADTIFLNGIPDDNIRFTFGVEGV